MSRRRAPGSDRPHVTPRRLRAVLLRYTDDEYRRVADAARCAGLTPSGYAAEAALAAAGGQEAPALRPERAALAELVRARVQVRKLGTNVNQATRQLNAVGEAPMWLEQAVTAATRAVAALETAAVAMTTATRRRPATGDRTSDTATATVVVATRTADVRERPPTRTPRVVSRTGTSRLANHCDDGASSPRRPERSQMHRAVSAGAEGGAEA